jgi:uncharacterized OsmC-like protein
MTTTEGTTVTAAGAYGSDPLDLWVERTGSRTYVGRNGRGAEVQIGPLENPGSFSPGELLKVALAACTGLTTDVVLARRLGDDFKATIRVSGAKDVAADRYPQITEDLVIDLDVLNEKDRARLLTIVHRAAEEHCTVGRTVTGGTSVLLNVNGSEDH